MTEHTPTPTEEQRLRANWVYVDASVYRGLQFDWNGRLLGTLAQLAQRGLIRVVVTDITRREVAGLMREMWSDANKSVQRSSIMLAQLGVTDSVSALADEEACMAKMQVAFEQWLQRCRAWTCDYEANLSTIMADYFSGNPPFGTGKKKAEFPDAVVASMLRAWCTATKQSAYVVSNDGDLKACCTPGGPLIYAASLAEVISHGTASAAVHDALISAIQESEWFFETMGDQVAALDVEAESGYLHGAKIEIEVESLKLEDIEVDEVIIDSDGTEMTCTAYLPAQIAIRARILRVAMMYGEDDWDLGSRHTQWITVSVGLTATVKVERAPDGSVELVDANLDDRRINIDWRDIERAID